MKKIILVKAILFCILLVSNSNAVQSDYFEKGKLLFEKNQIDKDIHTKAFEEKLQNEKSSNNNNSPMQLEFNFDKKVAN